MAQTGGRRAFAKLIVLVAALLPVAGVAIRTIGFAVDPDLRNVVQLAVALPIVDLTALAAWSLLVPLVSLVWVVWFTGQTFGDSSEPSALTRNWTRSDLTTRDWIGILTSYSVIEQLDPPSRDRDRCGDGSCDAGWPKSASMMAAVDLAGFVTDQCASRQTGECSGRPPAEVLDPVLVADLQRGDRRRRSPASSKISTPISASGGWRLDGTSWRPSSRTHSKRKRPTD